MYIYNCAPTSTCNHEINNILHNSAHYTEGLLNSILSYHTLNLLNVFCVSKLSNTYLLTARSYFHLLRCCIVQHIDVLFYFWWNPPLIRSPVSLVKNRIGSKSFKSWKAIPTKRGIIVAPIKYFVP